MAEARCGARNMNQSNPLYHYCGADAFHKIITSQEVWVSSAQHLDDTMELRWLPHTLKEMSKGSSETVRNFIEEVVGFFSQTLASLRLPGPRHREPFVASFSKCGDVLSQWRAYADDGRGFSVGITSDAFRVRGEAQPTAIEWRAPLAFANFMEQKMDERPFWGLVEIEYIEEEQRRQTQEVFDRFLDSKNVEQINEIVGSRFSSSPVVGDAEFKNLRASVCCRALMNLFLSFKNPAFREEQEVRLICLPARAYWSRSQYYVPDSIRYRITRDTVVPYLALGFEGECPVVNVYLGPRNRSQEEDVAEFVLQKMKQAPNTRSPLLVKRAKATLSAKG